jgi:Protein of unknown function (DUF1552)
MIITKKAISRRTVLRGAGAALALPLLDSMIPALSAAPKPVTRFGAVYVPNGIVMSKWTPADGPALELSPTLAPLEPFRDRSLVLTGLNSTPPPERAAALVGNHSRASTRFLTDVQPKPTLGSDLEAGISMDQIAAQQIGGLTPLASLELGLDSNETSGGGDTGYSRAYCSTIAWRSVKTPLPMENNPRVVFERLFGDAASTDPATRLARMKEQSSLLDSVSEKIARLNRSLGARDSSKLSEYLDAIRDIERRIQRGEQHKQEMPVMAYPAGIPETFAEHAKLMFDLSALAYQADMTRIITFMVGREFSGRTYPELGIHDAHHAISHHQNDPEKIAKLEKIDAYNVQLLTYYLEKLRSIKDGDGTLLDRMMLIYGAGMSDGNAHSPKNLPILLLGGGAGQLKPGRHLRYERDTPLANLHLAILDRMGVRVDKIGDSSGECKLLSDA